MLKWNNLLCCGIINILKESVRMAYKEWYCFPQRMSVIHTCLIYRNNAKNLLQNRSVLYYQNSHLALRLREIKQNMTYFVLNLNLFFSFSFVLFLPTLEPSVNFNNSKLAHLILWIVNLVPRSHFFYAEAGDLDARLVNSRELIIILGSG